jgi:hypothetical protein
MNLSNKTVAQLRRDNFRVKIHHFRDVRYDDGELVQNIPRMDIQNSNKIVAKGGKSEVFVTCPDGKHYKGVAHCNPKDSFNRKVSVKICLGRLQEIKEEEIKQYLS